MTGILRLYLQHCLQQQVSLSCLGTTLELKTECQIYQTRTTICLELPKVSFWICGVKRIYWSHSLTFESADVSLSGLPQALLVNRGHSCLPERAFSADVILVADVCVVHKPK